MVRARELLCVLFACALVACGDSSDSDARLSPLVQVFKSPGCGCCGKWAEHLEANGFKVQATEVGDLGEVKQRYGVPTDSAACPACPPLLTRSPHTTTKAGRRRLAAVTAFSKFSVSRSKRSLLQLQPKRASSSGVE